MLWSWMERYGCGIWLRIASRRPSVEHQEIIAREVNYFQAHEDHLHCSATEKVGSPMGSGAIKSLGKQLQRHLRGCGQFWSRPGLTHHLSLGVLVRILDFRHLWN